MNLLNTKAACAGGLDIAHVERGSPDGWPRSP